VTPTLDEAVLDFLRRPERQLSLTVGLVLLGVLLVAQTAKVVLQSTGRPTVGPVLRLLDVVVLPGILVFVLIVVERFRVLS
jgi:hypothetical protein